MYLLSSLTTLLVPLALVGTAIRLLLFPIFLDVEYRTPGFPADPFGLTFEERLHYGKLTMRYLVSNDSIEFFKTQTLPDGKPLYTALELAHMTDVKRLITHALQIWMYSLILLLMLSLIAWYRSRTLSYRQALRRGALLTLAFITAITLFSALAFGPFFNYFHTLLFSPGTWIFYESDTFIRLFPERFWQDIFLWAGGLIGLQALILLWALKKGSLRSPSHH